MAKKPKELPELRDHVKLRGRNATGRIAYINGRNWVDMDWDAGCEGPAIVHLFELELIKRGD